MDDKKKLVIIGVLTVLMLGIGAFQLVRSSGGQNAPAPVVAKAETPSATSSDDSKKDAAEPEQKNDLVKGSYAARDPFKPLIDANAPVIGPVAQATPTKPLVRRVATSQVFPQFPISKDGQLPGAAGPDMTPVRPPAPEFGYKLAGIIVGKKPAAVFIDQSGAQHLVDLGGSLDGDTRLVDLDREHVVLRYKNQTKNLTLGGGDSSAK